MDFKFYRKNVRRGSMTQKLYERWVMNDGVDPGDGDGGQQNRGGSCLTRGMGGSSKTVRGMGLGGS